MSLITLLVAITVIALVLWLITSYLPLREPFKTILIVVIVLIAVVWLVRAAGLA